MVIDVPSEIGNAKLGRFHVMLGVLIGLILVSDGYDLFNAAYAAHYVAALRQLSRTEIGTFLSSCLIGFTIGSLAHAPWLTGTAAETLCRQRCGLQGSSAY